MSFKSKKIFLGAILLIFFISVGCACATDNTTFSDSEQVSETLEVTQDTNIANDQSDIENIINTGSDDEIIYDSEIFVNSNFEEGKINSLGDVYGWNVTDGAAHGGSSNSGRIINYENNRVLSLGKVYYGSEISQNIDFSFVNSITFKYSTGITQETVDEIEMLRNCIGMEFEPGYIFTQEEFDAYYNDFKQELSIYCCDNTFSYVNPVEVGWYEVTIDTKDISGVGLFKIKFNYAENAKNIYFDNFTASLNDKVKSDFSHISNLIDNNVSVKFTNKAIGKISNIFWDFGDGTNSSEINPTHIFKSGNYKVTLTVSNENNTDSYSYDLSLGFPTIDGKMYATVQDAIDDAEEGAVIDIPNDLSENLNVNKTVTLNFNGNKLTGSINVNDGAMVSVTNISDVSGVSTDDSSKLTIVDSNINSNLELKSGNIDLNSVNFNNSILTITAANATLVNVNVANGGIVVNGGKSKITKSNFTDSTNVITQNAGELELTNNIIKNNNNAINITGGSATISYNAIYNNTGNLNLTGATVTNNWFGTNQVIGYESYLRLVLTSTDSEMYPGSEYIIKVEFVPNTGSMDGALNDLTLDITSTNGEITSPIIIADNQGELKFTAGAISDEVKFTLLGEDYTLVNDDNPVSIVAKPLDTNLVINSSAKGVVVIKLTTAEGNVVGAIVSYSINGAEKINATTDGNGEIIIKDLTGKVEINATYAGNKTLNPITGNGAFDFTETTDNKTNASSDSKPTTTTSTQTATAKTVKVASKIVAKKKTFKVKTKTKKYKITLKTKSGKAIKKVKVTLKVKGKTYKAKTNAKGVATFKITKLNKKGKYTAKIKFAGNKSYKATSKKIKLTVKK